MISTSFGILAQPYSSFSMQNKLTAMWSWPAMCVAHVPTAVWAGTWAHPPWPSRPWRQVQQQPGWLQLLWSNLVAAALHLGNDINEVGVVAMSMALYEPAIGGACASTSSGWNSNALPKRTRDEFDRRTEVVLLIPNHTRLPQRAPWCRAVRTLPQSSACF